MVSISIEAIGKCSILIQIKAGEIYKPEEYEGVFRGFIDEPNADMEQKGVFSNGLYWLPRPF